ncbi:MAG: glycosyltransferase [bacterium]|nr:glycosyltransferase [bacterium]
MIPKIIHYVWVGSKPKPSLLLKCIASWKRYCPDYEIREWNNESAAQIDNLYLQQALQTKKYAFASDYLRLYALRNEGGFYFDSDLEITHSIDKMREFPFISGYENWEGLYSPITAFMGACKDSCIIKDLISEYTDLPFIVNGEPDLTTNTRRITSYFKSKYGLSEPYNGHDTTLLGEDGILYPSYYFCTPEEGKDNYAIHHFNASWKIYENWERKKLFSIARYKLVSFKKLFEQDEDKFPLRDGEQEIKKWVIKNDYIISLLKKRRKDL